ncbi:MAG: hypothetical protein EBR27_12890 [Betaproteobacteria bacterium]|nr:hypothetical protein [Betaproteobacteria bacterium]
MNVEELKRRAITFEEELKAICDQSPEATAFAKYEPIVEVIRRAKAGQIVGPEQIPGMHYWHFETEILWKYEAMAEAFSRFSLLLSGLER